MFAQNYASFYDLCNTDKSYKKEIEFVYRWADKPKWVFDVGAGTGNYWKYYPKGTYVLGIDKSGAMASQNKNIICGDITKHKQTGRFDCATALFDVINYIPRHGWWKNLPLESGTYWVFDIWDKKKVDKQGFEKTIKVMKNSRRTITPIRYDGESVDLEIRVEGEDFFFTEKHRMYLHSHDEIKRFCGKEFKVVDVKPTRRWQTWYLCKRR